MDAFQSTLTPNDSISQRPYDDVVSVIEIVEEGSISTSPSQDSSQMLPAAPSAWLRVPPTGFLVVSDTDPESLARAKSGVERVVSPTQLIDADNPEQVSQVSVQL